MFHSWNSPSIKPAITPNQNCVPSYVTKQKMNRKNTLFDKEWFQVSLCAIDDLISSLYRHLMRNHGANEVRNKVK